MLSLALILLPDPQLHLPRVVVEAGKDLELEFLLKARSTELACITAASNMANTIRASCKECGIRVASCISNPSNEVLRSLGEAPLSYPSARMPNGVVLYKAVESSVNGSLALSACRESERRAGGGGQARVVCNEANTIRPYAVAEQAQKQSIHTTFTLLLALMGVLIAAMATALGGGVIAMRYTVNGRRSTTTAIQPPMTYPWLEKFVLLCVDVLIMLGTFVVLAWPSAKDFSSWSQIDRAAVLNYAVVVIFTIAWFWIWLEHYGRRRPFWDELRDIVRVLVVMFMVSGAAAFVSGLESGRLPHLLVWTLNLILIPLGRAGARQLLDDLGLWRRPAVILGVGENAKDAYLAIKDESALGYAILGFVDSQGGDTPSLQSLEVREQTLPVFRDPESFELLLDKLGNPQVIVALDSLTAHDSQLLVQRLIATNLNVHVIPAIRGLPLFGTQLSHFFSHQVLFLTLRNNLTRRGYIWIKRLFDLLIATLLLILLSPLFIVLAYLIKKDNGPAFYGHTRIGKNGRIFKCLKFRSMRTDAEKCLQELLRNDVAAREEWARAFKLRSDPRITRIGNFLRKTSLDELPQLVNVIKGEMSLVGPRPIVESELERYGGHSSLYLSVLPGMTGLWQISGRNDTSYAERVSLDAWYVQNWSLWYDIAILFKTVNVVLSRRGSY